MEVQLTQDQKAFVRQAIESGRLRTEEDAVKEALSLWEERERLAGWKSSWLWTRRKPRLIAEKGAE